MSPTSWEVRGEIVLQFGNASHSQFIDFAWDSSIACLICVKYSRNIPFLTCLMLEVAYQHSIYINFTLSGHIMNCWKYRFVSSVICGKKTVHWIFRKLGHHPCTVRCTKASVDLLSWQLSSDSHMIPRPLNHSVLNCNLFISPNESRSLHGNGANVLGELS